MNRTIARLVHINHQLSGTPPWLLELQRVQTAFTPPPDPLCSASVEKAFTPPPNPFCTAWVEKAFNPVPRDLFASWSVQIDLVPRDLLYSSSMQEALKPLLSRSLLDWLAEYDAADEVADDSTE